MTDPELRAQSFEIGLEVSRPIRPADWRAQGRGPIHPAQDRPHDAGWRKATIAAVQRRDRCLPLPARARDARRLTPKRDVKTHSDDDFRSRFVSRNEAEQDREQTKSL